MKYLLREYYSQKNVSLLILLILNLAGWMDSILFYIPFNALLVGYFGTPVSEGMRKRMMVLQS